jgi:hypothetical protein
MHGVTLDSEEDTVHVVARAVEESPYFLRKMHVLRSQRTTRGKLIQGIDGLGNPRKPSRCSLRGVVTFPQIPFRLTPEERCGLLHTGYGGLRAAITSYILG